MIFETADILPVAAMRMLGSRQDTFRKVEVLDFGLVWPEQYGTIDIDLLSDLPRVESITGLQLTAPKHFVQSLQSFNNLKEIQFVKTKTDADVDIIRFAKDEFPTIRITIIDSNKRTE